MTGDRIPADEPPELDDILARLRAQNVSMIEMSFVDNAGIVRVKTIPAQRLGFAARYGIGVSPCFETFCFDDTLEYGQFLGGPDGDLRLVPDLDRIVPLAAQPGWAWAPADKFVQDGGRFTACQRAFAAAQVRALDEIGLRASAAFEHEWAIGESGTSEFVPATAGSAYSQIRLEETADFAGELVDALHAQGLVVQQFHPEYTSGQLELSVAAADPIAAADDAILVRHTVRQVAREYDWVATFAPCLLPDMPGSGAHLHLSLRDDHGNLFADGPGPHGIRRAGEAFLAGVLAELPALLAIGAGNPASFLRMRPSRWAGVWQAWGRETREAALRLITGTIGTEDWAANTEVKCLDATANPYLVVGAVLAAGMAGIRGDLRLPEEIKGDPAFLGEDGGIRRLPANPAEAAQALADSTVLADALGEALHDAILTVRRAESQRYADTDTAELVKLTRSYW